MREATIRRRKPENDRSARESKDESDSVEVDAFNDEDESESSGTSSSEAYDGEYEEGVRSRTDAPEFDRTVGLHSVTRIIICLLVIVSFVVLSKMYGKPDHIGEDVSVKQLEEKMRMVRREFSRQKPHAWDEITSGILDVVLNKQKISTFVLLASESNTTNCLAARLGNISSTVLCTDEYLTLKPENQGHDTGEVLSSLSEQMKKKRVMVVQDLLNINTPTLMAFHYLCDRENPLVDGVIYIITIIDNRYKGSQDASRYVQGSINRKFAATITEDVIEPLITRITDGSILYIQQEQNIKDCLK